MKNIRGMIFNIQRFSVHDGPGIRDLVLFKGCPLRCQWCSNPESQNRQPEISYIDSRCIGHNNCGRCLDVCPVHAIKPNKENKIRIDRSLCTDCGDCALACPSLAIRLIGKYMRLEELLKIVEEDSPFYARSGGGITVGGGEPLAQAEFVQELLKESRRRGIDTAIETCGYGSWEDLKRTLSYANLIFYDIKHMDSNKHRAFTGVGNELILENITRFSSCLPDVKVIARTPVVPGFNDSEANITATARFLARIKGVTEYELLPYHGFGEPKYHQLDRLYLLSGSKVPSQEHMRLLKEIAHCIIASSRT